MERRAHDYLRRLPPEFYRGRAYVHWSMTVQGRATGWLNARSHAAFREIACHTMHRFDLVCPIYCLMPDHLHVLWIGLAPSSDQRKAARFLREHFNAALGKEGDQLQKQGHDHVLREADREQDAVLRLAFYIAENPVRAGLVTEAGDWPYSGTIAAGYPSLDWRTDDFTRRFWSIHATEVKTRVTVHAGGILTNSAAG